MIRTGGKIILLTNILLPAIIIMVPGYGITMTELTWNNHR
jgi:uncharacterized membrane protein YjjB (DUF3815 family)